MAFKKASKTKSKARVALISPSGAGKTYTALRIARGLAGPNGRIAVLDTERGSASKYADKFDFDVDDDFEGFAPMTYVKKIEDAARAGYDVLLIDSLSHAWMGKDGALEQVDKAKARNSGNSFAGWRDVTPAHNKMIDAIVTAPMDVIVTLRAKSEYVLEDRNGKKVPVKIGIGAVQRDGMEFEFDVVGELDQDHFLTITKSRCSSLADYRQQFADEAFGETLRAWLSDGVTATDDRAFHAAWDDVTGRHGMGEGTGRNLLTAKLKSMKLDLAGVDAAGRDKLLADYAAMTPEQVDGIKRKATGNGPPTPAPATPPAASEPPAPPEETPWQTVDADAAANAVGKGKTSEQYHAAAEKYLASIGCAGHAEKVTDDQAAVWLTAVLENRVDWKTGAVKPAPARQPAGAATTGAAA